MGPDGEDTSWKYHPIAKQYAGGASFHIDSVFIADVRPDVPGLEAVLLEEGRNYISLTSFQQGVAIVDERRALGAGELGLIGAVCAAAAIVESTDVRRQP